MLFKRAPITRNNLFSHPRIAIVIGLLLMFVAEKIRVSWRSYTKEKTLGLISPPKNFSDVCDLVWEERVKSYGVYIKSLYEAEEKRSRNISKWNGISAFDFYEPEWVCASEKRVGPNTINVGDGPKFICGPELLQQKNDCIIYSIGSNYDFQFEEGLRKYASNCKFHIFDGTMNISKKALPDSLGGGNISFHNYNVDIKDSGNGIQTKSLRNIINELGHHGKTINVFKIDCEGCEYHVLPELMELIKFGDVNVEQIQAEIHGTNAKKIQVLFQTLRKAGYATFHKERNHWGCKGYGCVEYAFINMKEAKNELFKTMKCPHMVKKDINSYQPSIGKAFVLDKKIDEMHHSNSTTWSVILQEIIKQRDNIKFLAKGIVHPMFGYFLCDWYIGTEPSIPKFWGDLPFPSARLLTNTSQIMRGHSIYVQHSHLSEFVKNMLPYLRNPIILVTGQWNLPKVSWSDDFFTILEHSNIIAWCMQNPVFEHSKIIPIPYGVLHFNLKSFATALHDSTNVQKEVWLMHLAVKNTHPSRSNFNNVCKTSKTVRCDLTRCNVSRYYQQIQKTHFMLSPMGDRPDTYRHWESIGLGAVPVCNCPKTYYNIFADNMLYIQEEDIGEFGRLSIRSLRAIWKAPDRRLISGRHWRSLLRNRVSYLSKMEIKYLFTNDP